MQKRDKKTDPFLPKNKGLLAQWVIEEILKSWLKDGRILYFHKDSYLDENEATDFLVTVNAGADIRVQIKSSKSGLAKHNYRHPHVKFVFIVKHLPKDEGDSEPIGMVESEFLSALNDFWDKVCKETMAEMFAGELRVNVFKAIV